MTYTVIALVVAMICFLALSYKQIIWSVAEKRALPIIEKVLFEHEEYNKEKVLSDIHTLTNNRLNDEMALDYFYKIKGVQVLTVGQKLPFWLKAYLKTPTKVKFNYFEQVKFYRTFLNYPDVKQNYNRISTNKVGEFIKSPLMGKLMPQKMA